VGPGVNIESHRDTADEVMVAGSLLFLTFCQKSCKNLFCDACRSIDCNQLSRLLFTRNRRILQSASPAAISLYKYKCTSHTKRASQINLFISNFYPSVSSSLWSRSHHHLHHPKYRSHQTHTLHQLHQDSYPLI